jgi:TonB-linked SusC/RagA family outer membrane protein
MHATMGQMLQASLQPEQVEKRISLQAKEKSIAQVIEELQLLTGYVFVFSNDQVNVEEKISFSASDEPLSSVLKKVFKNRNLSFRIYGDQVILFRERLPEGLKRAGPDDNKEKDGDVRSSIPMINGRIAMIPEKVLQQVIRGKVTDGESGEPLPGVNVLAKGTTSGTVSDIEGNYSLSVDDEVKVLLFSSIGFTSEEVEIRGLNIINVSLMPDIQALSEVVVVGYGTQNKRDLTSAISSIDGEDLRLRVATRIDQALQGQMSGVSIQQTSGVPGNAPFVRIRGAASINSANGPLYVVDGFPIEDPQIIGNLNMTDVESIEVLKDAASAAIYGSRGSNGVVIITTKKGKEGKLAVTYSSFYGVQEPEKLMDFMDANEFGEMITSSRNFAWVDRDPANNSANDPNSVRPRDYWINPEWTSGNLTTYDGQDYLFRDNAPIQNHNVSLSGASDKTSYFLSMDYFDQEGIIRGTGFERYSARLNLESKLNEKITLGLNIAPSYSLQVDRDTEGKDNSVNRMIWHTPIVPFDYRYDAESGSIVSDYLNEWNSGRNNLGPYFLRFENVPDERKRSQVLSTSFVDFKIIEGLHFRSSVGLNYNALDREIFANEAGGNGQISTQLWNAWSTNWLWENTLNFTKTFDKHNLTALLGYTSQKEQSKSTYFRGVGHANSLSPTINNATSIDQWDQNINEWSLLSMIGRLTYNFDSKYYLTASIRRDGSSRFGENNRWGIFPSLSGAWRVSEEAFLADSPLLSNLKLRASWGQTGNNRIGNYSAIATLISANAALGVNEDLLPGLAPGRYANQNLGWERTTSTNLGLDIGFLEDRFGLTVELYDNITEDLLLNVPVPAITGFESALQNIGMVSNRGIELDLTSNNINQGGFRWTTRLNMSWNKNEILELGPNGDPIVNGPFYAPQATRNEIGQPLGAMHLMVADGIFETQTEYDAAVAAGLLFGNERVGSVRFKDVDGDGDVDNDDRIFAGQPYPIWNAGITNEFRYKNFDLSIFINGAGGHHTYFAVGRYYDNPHPLRIKGYTANWVNRWRSEDDPGDGMTPTINYAGVATSGNTIGNTRWLFDSDWWRIKNITIGYTLPNALVERIGLGSVRVYGTGDNLALFTEYIGYNPEGVSNAGETLTREAGHDFGVYPLSRRVVFGINVQF